MELHSAHKIHHHSNLGEQKQEMLSLNRRLESYLNRVKLLEEENALLANEIQSLRHNKHGALTRRKGLEQELQQERLEVDAAWRDRVLTELEVGRLTDELQALNLQRQTEAQAHLKAKKMLEHSKKELEEEQRAQIWLREKVSQLEHEMKLLIQTHQEDVAHLEATLTQSRVIMPTTNQRRNQTPNLLQLGQEYSQRATRVWQEAAEAYQGQLSQLEESLSQASNRLTQVNQEKSESQLMLQALQKEINSAQDIRLHLEKTAAQQRDRYSQEIQQLQEHLGGLEVEKEELGQQIDHLVLQNRGLLQLKTSLGLEVATYRALLDSESLRGGVSLFNQPRNISITDEVFCSRGMKKNNQSWLSANRKIISISPVCDVNAKPICISKPTTLSVSPKISNKTADATQSAAWETLYPKILQDGAVESFRPQEVYEKVTHAEPLSPPTEQEALDITTSGDKEGEDISNSATVETPDESPIVESHVSYQVESGVSSEPHFNSENGHHLFAASTLTQDFVRITEKPCGLSDESDKDVGFEAFAEKEELQVKSHAPTDALIKNESPGVEVKHVHEDTSDSETETVLEPDFASTMSRPASECEPGEKFNQVSDLWQDENIPDDDTIDKRQEISSPQVGTNETNVEDKLYPDGEEMDTWDSVIERKIDVKTDDGTTKDEEKRQHAEPEEDISAREKESAKMDVREDFATDVQEDNVASTAMDTQEGDEDDKVQHVMLDQETALLSDKEDDEEDSQNVSVSWRTDLEGDSYAQENTLADTRPLIRYKSDETDGNTHASHMDESESSEGEQEKKTGETGTWSEAKSKRFGTMEDLCEEAEGEALDEEYDMGYTQTEDRDVGLSLTASEYDASVKDTENAEEIIKKVEEGDSDEETEEVAEPVVPTNVDYDEELDTDRLVEQELENLCTDSYSAHFAPQQYSESEETIHSTSVENTTKQEEAGQTETEVMFSYAEPELGENYDLLSSTAVLDNPDEKPFFSDSSVTAPQSETLAGDEIQHKDQNATDAPEKSKEEEEHNVSMMTHADETEDDLNDFISRPTMEGKNISDDSDSDSVPEEDIQELAAPAEIKEVLPADVSSDSEEHLVEGVADRQSFPDAAEAAEWEVLDNPSEDFEIREESDAGQKYDSVPESDEGYHHDEKGSDEGIMTHKMESTVISPDSVPDETEIFVVKDSEEVLDRSSQDNDLPNVFVSGIKNDFWVSSIETGATYQPDDTCNEAAEQTDAQNLEFGDSLGWGNLENTNVVNGNSGADTGSTKVLAAAEDQGQIHSEVKHVLCRNVEGTVVYSEESEVEGESWSSGEEPV